MADAPAPQPHLYLVDGSSFIFRAYHRLPPLTDPDGTPVNAVFGFTSMLWKLIEDLNRGESPTHLAVVLDASKHSFRMDLYPDYKANRPEPPEDLVPQFPLIRDAVRAFSVPCIEETGIEADDIIACYAIAARAAGMKVTIVSSDKDLMQLVGNGVDMLDTMRDLRIDVPQVEEKFGVPPAKVGEVLALMGDSVDNIPGVRGVGPKTATQLIQQFGDVETLIARAAEIKRDKLREAILASTDDIRLSRKLVELKTDWPLPEPISDFALRDPPHEPLAAFFKKHGFRSLLAKLGKHIKVEHQGEGPPTPPEDYAPPLLPVEHDRYETVTTPDALDAWIAEATRLGTVAVDTETDNLDAMRANLVGVSLATAPNRACYIPLAHVAGDGLLGATPQQLDRADALRRLQPLFEDPATLKIGQNVKYDMLVLARQGIAITPFDDTMLMSYALDAGKRNGHGMDALSANILGHAPIPFKQVAGSGKAQVTFDKVPLQEATHYAAEDADVTFRLWRHLKPRLWREKVTRVYERLERPLVPVLVRMERRGVKVDRAVLARLSADYAEGLARIEKEIEVLAGEPFNIASPAQLGTILFDRMGLPGGRKSPKTGAYSTDVDVLEKLADDGVGLARKVLDWRQLAKLKSTYTDALQAQINPETGRVHTSYALAAATTGRLASTDPNLQNIPVRTEEGRKIRDAFVAEGGNVLLSADYSQIELRLLAHMADIPALKQAFADGLDIHAMTASEMFGVPIEGMPADVRRQAKAINFGIIYGISAFGLARNLGIDRGVAADYIKTYFERFPGIRDYMERTKLAARDQGYVETLFGRRIWTPMIKSSNQAERGFAERAAINAPLQGTAADIIRRAMIRMEDALAAEGLTDAAMLLQVHDELIFEVPTAMAEAAGKVIARVMAAACDPVVKLDVELVVDVGTGPNWGAAH
jgi:DNA polymerase-1